MIGRSDRPATHRAREYAVSDTLIRKIRRGELWVEGPERRRNDISRVAIIATLVLARPRISELCKLDGGHVNLAQREIKTSRVKTDASERVIPLVSGLHEILLAHRAARLGPERSRVCDPQRTRNTPDNIRRHVVDPVHASANELLSNGGGGEIARLTPHTLRRTFAPLLAELGVSPRRAMYLLGHADAKLTMNVYQQVLDLRSEALESFESVLGCSFAETFATFSGRGVLGPKKEPGRS